MPQSRRQLRSRPLCAIFMLDPDGPLQAGHLIFSSLDDQANRIVRAGEHAQHLEADRLIRARPGRKVVSGDIIPGPACYLRRCHRLHRRQRAHPVRAGVGEVHVRLRHTWYGGRLVIDLPLPRGVATLSSSSVMFSLSGRRAICAGPSSARMRTGEAHGTLRQCGVTEQTIVAPIDHCLQTLRKGDQRLNLCGGHTAG